MAQIGICLGAYGILSQYEVPWYLQSVVFLMIAVATEIGPRFKRVR